MKNGLFTTISNGKDREAGHVNQLEQHQKKILLSVWWDYKGIVYFELLPLNRTINSVVYIEQLTKLNDAVEEKRPESTNRKGAVFHHDFGHSAKIIGAWLGCFATSTI